MEESGKRVSCKMMSHELVVKCYRWWYFIDGILAGGILK